MRPLFHPSIEDVTVEALLHALSDPLRVAIYVDILSAEHSQNCSSFQKISIRPVAKSTLSQHFKVLREAGLVRGERRGVEMHNISRFAEIDQRFPGLLKTIVQAYGLQSSCNSETQTPAKKKAAVKPARK